jgi:hypothetical protein
MRRALERAMRRAIMTAVALATAAAIACGAADVPRPPYARHPTSALVEVPYPPPPARVEVVPKKPKDGAVWIDGEWNWETRRWAWRRGRWVMVPPGARFAPWTAVRDRFGTLYFAAGTWRGGSGAVLSEPPSLATGSPMPAAIVSPEGEEVPTGPTLPMDAGRAPSTQAAGDAGGPSAPGDAGDSVFELDASAAPGGDRDGAAGTSLRKEGNGT